MTTDRPPATGSRHPLPFERLSPEDFERLCYALVRREGYDAVEHEGVAGADEGCDILAFRDGERIIFQCKRYPRLSPSEAAAVVDKILGLPAAQRPQKLVLIVAGTVSHQARERFRERAGSMACEVWARTELDERVHRDPNLLEQFFALPRAHRTLVAPATDKTPLKLWLRGVVADHQQLTPYFQRQPELDLLQRVYVDLQLTAETDRAGFSASSKLGTPTELREALDLDPADHPWVTRRWVILGDPGAGKTTLLRHFTATLAADRYRTWVPVFESLPQLLRSKEFILDPIGRRMERLGRSGEKLKALLKRRGTKGHLLLLLDGLDEVPRERREEAEQILRDLADCWQKSPLVVTSRPIGYRRPGADFRELSLLPLDRERRRAFLARWLGRETGIPDETRAARALSTLDSPELRELAGNPLYLTLMALLFESGIEPDRNRTRLYDQVFALLFEGRHHGPLRESLEAQETVRAVLRRLAYDLTAEGRDTEPVTGLEKRLRSPELDGLRATLERVSGWNQMRPFLDDLSQKTGIIGPHDGPSADWRFWHRTFREALTAEQLAEDYRRERGKPGLLWANKTQVTLPALVRRIKTEDDLSRWAEPFALLVGHVDNPDDLVRALVEENRPLGLRALATAQSLSDRTIDEILLLTEKREERQKLYRRVADLVGEPRRALSLLDRLRRRTRNGNELYFLDQAIQEVARRFPNNAWEAVEIRTSLYSHIRPPAEDLFLWVDTPMDGRVPLWRELPAGRFQMGSPKGEGWYQERPHHEAQITARFHCGAVPVTNAQYAAFDPDHKPLSWKGVKAEELPHHPVEGITWFEACSFCRWLAASFPWARGARLPTEEEWEYACRAGTQSRYWSGDDEKDLATVGWYSDNSLHRTHRVGEKPANPWGLYDIHGNVWEWTLSLGPDSYVGREGGVSLEPTAVEVPAAELPGGEVIRGGSSWNNADGARAAYRGIWYPDVLVKVRGFRVVLPAASELPILDHRS